MKIKVKLIIIFLITSFGLISIISFFLYLNTKNAVTQSVINNLNSIASLEKNRVLQAIENTNEKIILIENRLGLKTNLVKYLKEPKKEYQDNIVKNLNDVFPSLKSFRNISVLNTNGKIIASTEKKMLNTDLSKNEAFLKGLQKNNFDNFFINESKKPAVYFSGPIILEKKLIGVILVESNLEQLLPFNKDFTGLGETGEIGAAKKLNKDYCVTISSLRFYPDSFLKLKVKLSNLDRPIVHALNKEEAIFTDKINYRGKNVITATRFVPGTDWAFTVNMDKDEVYAPIYRFKQILFIFVGITLLLVIAGAIILSEQITRAITDMTDIAIKISKGIYSEKVNVKSKDEIGILGEAFNQMTENLINSNQEITLANQNLQEEIILRKNIEAELEKFAYVSSHDLQEPLRTITSFTQLIEKNYKDKFDEDGKEYLGLIINASSRMKIQINDLLAYSKLNYESKNFKPVDFNKIIIYIISTLTSTIEEHHITINYGTLPLVPANYILIFQLFSNLISNSIKFRSDKLLVINIKATEQVNDWLFSVSDNGIGIEAEYLKKIFEVFQRLHTRDAYEGSGLGLSMCRKILEIHNGKIWLESELGKGSEFFFTIPK